MLENESDSIWGHWPICQPSKHIVQIMYVCPSSIWRSSREHFSQLHWHVSGEKEGQFLPEARRQITTTNVKCRLLHQTLHLYCMERCIIQLQANMARKKYLIYERNCWCRLIYDTHYEMVCLLVTYASWCRRWTGLLMWHCHASRSVCLFRYVLSFEPECALGGCNRIPPSPLPPEPVRSDDICSSKANSFCNAPLSHWCAPGCWGWQREIKGFNIIY